MEKKIELDSPIGRKTILENARKWLNIIRFRESGTIVQFQDDCEYRVREIITNPLILKNILGPYYRKYILLYIPGDQKNIGKTMRESLLTVCKERKIAVPNKLISLERILDIISQKGLEVGIFLSRISNRIQKNSLREFFELEYILEKSKNLSIILFSEIDITHPNYHILTDKCSLLFDHVIYYPLYQSFDAHQFISYNNKLWKMKLQKAFENEIIHMCGGYLWIISHLQRFLRDNKTKSLTQAYRDPLLIKKLGIIWDKLSPKEQQLIRKVTQSALTNTDTLSHEFHFLLNIRMLEVRNNKVTLGIPILTIFILKEQQLGEIYLVQNKIMIKNQDVTRNFSPLEKKFITFLLDKKKVLVSREEVAQTLWGKLWEEKYSDWALDRLSYRLRKKLNICGIDPVILKTAKRKGFLFG